MADSFWGSDSDREEGAERPLQKPQQSTWQGWPAGWAERKKMAMSHTLMVSRDGPVLSSNDEHPAIELAPLLLTGQGGCINQTAKRVAS